MQGRIPDEWQRCVMNEVFELIIVTHLFHQIDSQNSVLVCAATSLGKTAVSFYAIHRTLQLNKRNSERKMVVYVAPTKALVNQGNKDD